MRNANLKLAICCLAFLLACSSAKHPVDAPDAGEQSDAGADAGYPEPAVRPWTCDRVKDRCANRCAAQTTADARDACDVACVPTLATKHALICASPVADAPSRTCDDVLQHCQNHCSRLHTLLQPVCAAQCPAQRAAKFALTCTFPAADAPLLFPPAADCAHVASVCTAECGREPRDQRDACRAACPGLLAAHSGLTCP